MTTVDRLIELIEREGLKPAHITKELGISNYSFTDWKRRKGKPSLEVLVKFAKRFDVSLDWLVFGKEQDPIRYSNPDENKLINNFRKLSPENRTVVLAYIDGMLASVEPGDEEKRLSS